MKSDAAFYFDFASSLCDNTGPSALQGKVSQVEQVSQGTAIVQVTLDEQTSGWIICPANTPGYKSPALTCVALTRLPTLLAVTRWSS